MRTLFSTQEVSELTGASVRQVDYWGRTGLLKPSGRDANGRGTRRRYTFRDIVAAQTIQKLRTGDCPLQKIRKAIRHLQAHYPADSNANVLARLVLLTDGSHVYLLSDGAEVMDVISKQMVWAVPLGKLIVETGQRIAGMRTEWAEKVQVRGRTYHLEVQQDDQSGEFTVQCRELPGAIEQGRTAADAVASGKTAIESVLTYEERRNAVRGAGRVAAW